MRIRSPLDSPDLLERLTMTALEDAVAAAAVAAAHTRGRCDPIASDQAAVDAMRRSLNARLLVPATVVAGEGEKDGAPMLHVGEAFGPEGDRLLSLVADPLEGTNLCARGESGAICVLAAALEGEGVLLPVPEGYMSKLVLGTDLAGHVAMMRSGAGYVYPHEDFSSLLDMPVSDLARHVAVWRRKSVRDVINMVLDRPRNQGDIDALRNCDVQLKLIRDGDVTAALLALDPHHDVDFTNGIGGSVEMVLSAAMARCYGGYAEACWWLPETTLSANTEHAHRIQKAGFSLTQIYHTEDLAQGHVFFALAAVTGNDLLPGVRFQRGGTSQVHLVSGQSRTNTIRRQEVTVRQGF